MFSMEIHPGTSSISIALYHMALIELWKLNKQLEDLLEVDFICPSTSPWGALGLFSKKDGIRAIS